jgi:hypothetical protein
MAAADVALDADEVARLSALFAADRVAGGRRPAAAAAIDPRG